MTGGIAYRQQDGFVLGARPVQRLLAPRVPIDRVRSVLQQIRAGFVRQAIGHDGGDVRAPGYPTSTKTAGSRRDPSSDAPTVAGIACDPSNVRRVRAPLCCATPVS